MLQGLFSWLSWASPSTEIPENTIPYHICGVYNRKQRLANNKTTPATRRASITTVNYAIKKNKEENNVSALKQQIMEELNLPKGCEIKLFYGGQELGKDSELLSLYVLEQDRDTLFDPHIVVAVKEGLIKQPTATTTATVTPTTSTTSTSDKPEEKKIESTCTATETTETLSVVEQEFQDYQKFEVKTIKACDPIILEQCDCYSLPGCDHGISGDSLETYAWLTANGRKESVIRCPNIKVEENNQDTPVCGNKVPFTIVKKILSHHSKKKGTKKKVDQTEKAFALEVALCENYLQEHYDVQKCKQCHTILYRELKADKSATIQFKSVCPLCTCDKEEKDDPKRQLERRSSMFNLVLGSGEVTEKADTKKVKVTGTTSSEQTKVTTTEQVKQTSSENVVNETSTTTEQVSVTTSSSTPTEKKEEKKEDEKANEFAHAFCWACGNHWKDTSTTFCGHPECVTQTRAVVISILSNCNTKKIGQVDGVPEIRGCPTCGQMVNHTEACKHMTCRCNAAFCFVCMKPKLNGNWQCGSSGDVCSIYQRQTNEDLPAGNRSNINLFSFG